MTYSHCTAREPLHVNGIVLGEQVEELEYAALHREALVVLEGLQDHSPQVLPLDRGQQRGLEELLQTNVPPGEDGGGGEREVGRKRGRGGVGTCGSMGERRVSAGPQTGGGRGRQRHPPCDGDSLQHGKVLSLLQSYLGHVLVEPPQLQTAELHRRVIVQDQCVILQVTMEDLQ